jgi:hypothetical protein
MFDCNVAADTQAGFIQSLLNSRQTRGLGTPRLTMEDADHWHPSLLRARGKHTHSRRTNNGEELAPPHSTLSSPWGGHHDISNLPRDDQGIASLQ